MTTVADTVAAVWRIESARLTAALARRTRGDLALAEDLASETFAAALRQWPVDGVPRHPGSWLMATAHHRLVDHARRRTTGDRKHTLYAADQLDHHDPTEEVTDMLDDPVRDDELTLILMSCHPTLSRDNQIALTLKVVAGLQAAEIARAFLISETTAAQRIVRAKRRLATAGARFEMPGAADLPARLGVVLAVIYAIFNEGYASAAGEDWTRPELCHDALRLGRRVVALQPDASRGPRPGGPDGAAGLPVAGAARGRRDPRTAGGPGPPPVGPAADPPRLGRPGPGRRARRRPVHAAGRDRRLPRARGRRHLDRLAPHRRPLRRAAPPHAVTGPGSQPRRRRLPGRRAGRGLERLDALTEVHSLQRYPLFHAARGDMLERLGRFPEAAAAFVRAAELETNQALRAVFARRAEHQRRMRDSNPRGREPNTLSKRAP